MNKKLKEDIKLMHKEKVRQILTSSSSSKEDKKIAEDELIKRNSDMRGDDDTGYPIIDSKEILFYVFLAFICFKIIKHLVEH
jgi:hypothetical protein